VKQIFGMLLDDVKAWWAQGFASVVAAQQVVFDWQACRQVTPGTNVTALDLTSLIGTPGNLEQAGLYVSLFSVGAVPNSGLGESRVCFRNGPGATDVSVTATSAAMIPVPENGRVDLVLDIRNPFLYYACKATMAPELTVIVSSRPIGTVKVAL